MSWSLFFTVLAILYTTYYVCVIGWDLIKSKKESGEYKEEVEQVGLGDFFEDEEPKDITSEEEDESENVTDSPEAKKNLIPQKLKPEREKINITKDVISQGLPLDQFRANAKAKRLAIYQ